ncbi:MAG: hypothetical protein OXN25_12000 [Candidatus Poribacteria bacterium]|nr:hypothetical protein [Candidatus Poribacteria bacterium]
MTKHFRFLSIVLVGLLSLFVTSCDEGMDAVIDTVTNGPSPDEQLPRGTPATRQSYVYHGTLNHQETIRDLFVDGVLVSLGEDSVKVVWDIQEESPVPENLGRSSNIFWIMGFDGDFGATAASLSTTYIEVNSLPRTDFSTYYPYRHTSPVRAFDRVFAQGRVLYATGSSDTTVHVWENVVHDVWEMLPEEHAELARHKHTLEHEGQVWAVAFSPDGQTLASGGGFEGIYLWDPNTGESKGAPLIANTAQVEGLAFSADGQTLAVATGLGTGAAIHLWDLRTNQLTETLVAPAGYTIRKVAISPDGQTIAGGAYDPVGPGVLLWKRE